MRITFSLLIILSFLSPISGQIELIHDFENTISIIPSNFRSTESKALFTAWRYTSVGNPDAEIWMIDNQTGHTEQIPFPSTSFYGYQVGVIGEDLIAPANHKLWSMNLETYATQLLKDSFSIDHYSPVIPFNDKLIYPGTSVTDGTTDGSFFLFSGDLDQSTRIGNRILGFAIHTGEVWITDGTLEGSEFLATVEPEDLGMSIASGIDFGLINTGENLWATDGTPEGTNPIVSYEEAQMKYMHINVGANIGNARVFKAINADNVIELWRTDGTSSGTVLIKGFTTNDTNPGAFFTFNDTVYFTIENENSQLELWTTNGTTAGTTMQYELEKEYKLQSISEPRALGHGLLFNCKALDIGESLTYFDGSKFKVIDERPGNAPFIGSLYNFRSVLSEKYFYFLADDGKYGQEIWQVDSLGNTKMLADFTSGARWTSAILLGSSDHYFYFLAKKGNAPHYSLFRYDESNEINTPAPTKPYEWFQSIGNPTPWYTDLYPNVSLNARLEVDHFGNIYSLGTSTVPAPIVFFQDTIGFDDNTERGAYYLAKIAPDGKANWMKVIENIFPQKHPALHLDQQNNLLFGGQYAPDGSDTTVLIQKIAPDGSNIWTKGFNLGQQAKIYQITSDTLGFYYAAGSLANGSYQIGAITLDVEEKGHFLAKFDADGNPIWANYISKDAEWERLNPMFGLTVDGNSNLYFAVDNMHRYDAYFNDCEEVLPTEMKVYSFGEDGSARWIKSISSDDVAYIADLEISPNDSIYLLGYFRHNLKFSDTVLETPPCKKGHFLLKMDAEGTVTNSSTQTNEILFPFDLEFDDCGHYYIAGIKQTITEVAATFYPGYYHYPFERGFRQSYVHKYDFLGNQLDGRTFYKRKDDYFATQLAIKDEQILLQGNYSYMLDTLAESSSYVATNKSFLLNFKFEEECNIIVDPEPTIPPNEEFILSPNPTIDELYIYLREDVEQGSIIVFNNLGQTVSAPSTKVKGGFRLDTSSIKESGIYNILLEIGNRKLMARFIKH